MDNPEKLAAYSTQDKKNQNKNTTQYVLITTTNTTRALLQTTDINRLLYSVMCNMERYCTSLYCIAASSPIRVFNTIRTSTISFYIVHITV